MNKSIFIKLLNPIYVGIFIIVLTFGGIGHLMYGSCQTTKWHYIAQCYWLPSILPEELNSAEVVNDEGVSNIKVYKHYTGVWRRWYDNGNIESEIHLIDNIKQGVCKWWYDNGILMKRFNYKDGIEDGLFEMWYDNGELMRRFNYKEGKEDGLFKVFYRDGKKRSISTYIKGAKQGEWVRWSNTGVLKEKILYFNNILLLFAEYNKKGVVSSKEYYDEKGNFQKRELFEKGKLVKTETEE